MLNCKGQIVILVVNHSSRDALDAYKLPRKSVYGPPEARGARMLDQVCDRARSLRCGRQLANVVGDFWEVIESLSSVRQPLHGNGLESNAEQGCDCRVWCMPGDSRMSEGVIGEPQGMLAESDLFEKEGYGRKEHRDRSDARVSQLCEMPDLHAEFWPNSSRTLAMQALSRCIRAREAPRA
jgi:hypothetical protein